MLLDSSMCLSNMSFHQLALRFSCTVSEVLQMVSASISEVLGRVWEVCWDILGAILGRCLTVLRRFLGARNPIKIQ